MGKKYLNFEEQCELVKKSLAGDEKALAQLLDFTYPFIAKLAGTYLNYGCEFEDLIQEGNIAIYNALPKYRPEFKAKFSTYATWHIRKRMHLYAQNQRMIQIPPVKLEKLKAYRALLEEADPDASSSLSDAQMADLLGITEKEYYLIKNIPVSYLGQKACVEVIEDKEPSLDTMEDQAILNVIVDTALDQLPEKERYVLCRYYQLQGFEKKATLEDIARELGCSREWVRQLLIGAKEKLHELLKDVKDM